MTTVTCEIFNHQLGEPVAVTTNFGHYMARICKRCGERFPVSDKDREHEQGMRSFERRIMRDYK
jgi:hypothetical protein